MNRAAGTAARTPRRRPQPQTWKPSRDRREVVITVLVVVGITAATVLMIWLLRPESKPGANDGGILTRQARIAWYLVILASVFAVVYALGRRITRRRRGGGWMVAIVGTAAFAVVLGLVWPGGLVVPQPKAPTPPPPQALGSLLPSMPEPFPQAPPPTTAPAPEPSAPAAPEAPGTTAPAPGTTAPVPAPTTAGK